jgi:hypothetical protein
MKIIGKLYELLGSSLNRWEFSWFLGGRGGIFEELLELFLLVLSEILSKI